METPRTSSGKPCKKCTAKGASCYLHCVPLSKSPKKSGKKKSSKKKSASAKSSKRSSPAKFDIGIVPLPALQEILLKIDRAQLYDICTSNRQAAKICKLESFRKRYQILHPANKFVVGKLTVVSRSRAGDRSWIDFRDQGGHYIIVSYDKTHVRTIKYLSGLIGSDVTLDVSKGVATLAVSSSFDVVLNKIGMPHWSRNWSGTKSDVRVLSPESMREAVEIILSRVEKVEPSLKNLKFDFAKNADPNEYEEAED